MMNRIHSESTWLGIPVLYIPFVRSGTAWLIAKGTPEEYIVTDKWETLERMVDENFLHECAINPDFCPRLPYAGAE